MFFRLEAYFGIYWHIFTTNGSIKSSKFEIGTFGTAAEAADSGFEVYRKMPAILYPKAENITVTCPPDSKISAYCKKYGIPTGE